MPDHVILVLNSGSSSLKFGVYSGADGEPRPIYRGEVEGIGADKGKLWLKNAEGKALEEESRNFAQQSDAAKTVAEKLSKLKLPKLAGIGHRVVHGGPSLTTHQRITPQVLQTLEGAAHFAPLHVPAAIALIREVEKLYPGVPQFACFDTAFHTTMPEAAARLPLPKKYWDAGIRKYGFHGLSCESIVHALRDRLPKHLIIAHLGNGASITAVVDGKSVDTTMGLTPTGGIIMGTRPGDLDPGVLLHLLNTGTDVKALAKLLDKESGLLGISGTASDMRKLHEAADNGDSQAGLAIEMFARVAAKAIGGFAAMMGNLDALIFTGGIGEHDAEVRAKIYGGMKIFGVQIDEDQNKKGAPITSHSNGAVSVKVIATDEDGQIARHVARLLANAS
ncbi:MAG: acetate/propionate family kinase [Acidobacteria bacterium]|nr:acetate/propionate family kinase [Acidobacteriota bacterium]